MAVKSGIRSAVGEEHFDDNAFRAHFAVCNGLVGVFLVIQLHICH